MKGSITDGKTVLICWSGNVSFGSKISRDGYGFLVSRASNRDFCCTTHPGILHWQECHTVESFLSTSAKVQVCSAAFKTVSYKNIRMIYRDRVSRDRVIRLLAHPLPPHSRQQTASLSQSSCMLPDELTDGGGGGGGGGGWGQQTIRPRECLALYK